jgi:phosphohistidine phosphatase SixA
MVPIRRPVQGAEPELGHCMIVFVIRHAEKKLQPQDADGLTPAGVKRAELLARMLAESGISVACCSQAQRAQQTLVPLKTALGAKLSINTVAIGGPGQPGKHVNEIVGVVQNQQPDAIVAVVSHSDTVPLILEKLGVGTIKPIKDSEFDRLFVLIDGPTGKTLLQLRYGEAT